MSLGGAQRTGSTAALERGILSPDIPWPALSQLIAVHKPRPWTGLVPSLCSPFLSPCARLSQLPLSPHDFTRNVFPPRLGKTNKQKPKKPQTCTAHKTKQTAELYRRSRFPTPAHLQPTLLDFVREVWNLDVWDGSQNWFQERKQATR